MRLRVQRSEWFIGDLEHYAAWYNREASWELAERYLHSVADTLAKLAEMPGMGRSVRFTEPKLQCLRFWAADRPFQKHLIFYRYNQSVLYCERVVHGARDLQTLLSLQRHEDS